MRGFKAMRNHIQIRPVKNALEMKNIHVAWARKEGWNPGVHDHDFFYETDPGGFLVCTVDQEPVSCISLVNYNEQYAFLGYYIAAPRYRHQGYGWRIWQAAMERAGDREIGLDGVVSEQDNYKKSGFIPCFSSMRYALTQSPTGSGLADSEFSFIPGVDCDPLLLLNYDEKHAGTRRSHFITRLVSCPDTFSFVAISKKNHEIVGLGVIRKADSGYRVGPLFSDSIDIVRSLLQMLCDQVNISTDSPVFLDVPACNRAGMEIVTQYNMKPVFECARMIKPSLHAVRTTTLPTQQIFGITSWELG